MNKQTLFNKFVTVPFLIVALAICGCKKDDSEDDDGSGAGGGGGGGGGGSGQTTGGSIIFDGSGEHLLTSRAWYTGDFTICLWMKPASVTGQTLLSMSGGDKYFYLSFDADDIDWRFESANDADIIINPSVNFTAGTVYHVCVSGDHSQATAGSNGGRLYINGVQYGSPNIATDGVASALSSDLVIGYEPSPGQQVDSGKTNPFNGTMDNVMIWNMILPASAITTLYGSGAGFDPRFSFGNYTVTHRNALQVYYLMGDDPADTLSGVAIINDTEGNQDAIPVGFESNDFDIGFW